MWTIVVTDEYEERLEGFGKKNGNSIAYLNDKLKVLVTALGLGGRFQDFKFGFLKSERHGLFAICCSGKGMRVLRLYLYPDEELKKLHQITIGDKNAQSNDIRNCHLYIRDLRLRRDINNEDQRVQNC